MGCGRGGPGCGKAPLGRAGTESWPTARNTGVSRWVFKGLERSHAYTHLFDRVWFEQHLIETSSDARKRHLLGV